MQTRAVSFTPIWVRVAIFLSDLEGSRLQKEQRQEVNAMSDPTIPRTQTVEECTRNSEFTSLHRTSRQSAGCFVAYGNRALSPYERDQERGHVQRLGWRKKCLG